MRKVLKMVATIALPIAAVLWCSFCILPSPYLKRLSYPLGFRMDTTYTNFPGWICPAGHEGIGVQPISVAVHNRSSHQLVYHVTFNAWDGAYPNILLCSEDVDVLPSGTGQSTCRIDFSTIETNESGLYVVEVSAGPDQDYWELPSSEAPQSYWELCVTLTKEDNLLAIRYAVLAGIAGFMLLIWGTVLLYKSNWFSGAMVVLTLLAILPVLNFVISALVPYHYIAWVLEFVWMAGIVWWSHRRQKSFPDSHIS